MSAAPKFKVRAGQREFERGVEQHRVEACRLDEAELQREPPERDHCASPVSAAGSLMEPTI